MKNRHKYLLAAALLAATAFSALSAASVKLIPANEGIENVSVESDLFVDGLKASKVTLSYAKKILKDSVSIDDYRIEGRVITDVQVDGKDVTMQVEVGQKVIYSKYAGTEVKLDGQEMIIVRQSDILAVVE